jgi:choline kinase
MKAIILAAGQGTRLRPLTDHMPKCMVEVAGLSIIGRQLAAMNNCGIAEKDILIVCGYQKESLQSHLADTRVQFVFNADYETTNMVYSLMCAKEEMEKDIIVSYGDIIYEETVLKKLMTAPFPMSVVIDDRWLDYWNARNENPLSDAETLRLDREGNIIEIGQKPNSIAEIESQYIGLMRFRSEGLTAMLRLAEEAQRRSAAGEALWRTERNYQKMYMTDLLQGLADTGEKLRAVRINRGWFEIDNPDDLRIAEKNLCQAGS